MMSIPLERINRMSGTTEAVVRKLHPRLIRHIDEIDGDKEGSERAPYVPPRPLSEEWFSRRGFKLFAKNGFHRRAANVRTGGVKHWLVLYVAGETGKVELSGLSASTSGDGMPVRVALMKTIDSEEDLDNLLVALGFDEDLTGPAAEARREEYRRKLAYTKLRDACLDFDDVSKDGEINAYVIPLGKFGDPSIADLKLLVFEDGGTGVREDYPDGSGSPSRYTRLHARVSGKDDLGQLFKTLKGE